MKQVPLGRIHAHAVTATEALDHVTRLIASGKGGYIVTPNVDHVVQAEHSNELAAAYEEASLSLVDGQPLVWLSRLIGDPLPAKISGSDFVPLLMETAAREGWRVFFLGAAEGVGAKAADVLRKRLPALQIVGIESPRIGFDQDGAECDRLLGSIHDAQTDLLVLALGCPKQELLMHRWKGSLGRTVAIGSGATLDFIAGNVPRAPRWMSDRGLEWLFRLAREPRRLSRRYLVRDPQILGVAWRMVRSARREGGPRKAQRRP